METNMIKEALQKLAAPFPESVLRWRAAVTGLNAKGEPWVMCICYLTKTDIAARLDSAVGAQNWKISYKPGIGNSTICRLEIRCGDEWIYKEGVGEPTDVSPARGSATQALKNAALAFSVGRVYAELPPMYGIIAENGTCKSSAKDRSTGSWVNFRWNPPRLPAFAIPESNLKVLNGDKVPPAQKEPVKPGAKTVQPPSSAKKTEITMADVPSSLRDLFAELQINDAKALDLLKRKSYNFAEVERILQDIRVDSVAAGA